MSIQCCRFLPKPSLNLGVWRLPEFRIRHKNGTWVYLEAIGNNLLTDPTIRGVVVNSRDVTARKQAEAALQHQFAFEQLVAEISKNFINLASTDIDQGILQVLQTVGEFSGVDRSFLCFFSPDRTAISCTHECCASGVESQREVLQNLSVPLSDLGPYSRRKNREYSTFRVLPTCLRRERGNKRFSRPWGFNHWWVFH